MNSFLQNKSLIRVASILLLFFSVLISNAATYYIKPTSAGSGDGSSWTNASSNLQDVINSASSGDEIWVAAGTYKPTRNVYGNVSSDRNRTFSLRDGVKLYGGFSGSETLLSQRDITNNVTVLSGDLDGDDQANFVNYTNNAYHVVTGLEVGSGTGFDGFTVSHGNANGNYYFISGNIIITAQGGGYYSTSLNALTFTISNIKFIDNFGNEGGAASIAGPDAGLTTNWTNCTFSNNKSAGNGGALLHTHATSTLTNCLFTDNTSTSGTGTIYSFYLGLTLKNCIFKSNSASYGGAVGIRESSLTSYNSVFINNSSTNEGGVFIGNGSGPVSYNCTFINNTTGTSGSAIYGNAGSTSYNCIFWNNTGGSGLTLYDPFNGNSHTVNNSVITQATSTNYGGSNNVSGNPNFTSTSNYIGNDGVWRTSDDGLVLGCGSSAYNTGSNSFVNSNNNIDIIGTTRPSFTTADIGAYESGNSLSSSSVTINTQPEVSTSYCQNATASALSVSATGTGLTYQWYSNINNSNTGGSIIGAATNSTYTPLTSSSGSVYYYCIVSAVGCATAATTNTALINVTSTPSAPAGTDANACFDGSAITGSASVGSGETVVWYDAATGGNVTTAPSGTTAGIYTAYAEAKNTTTLCTSATRTLVTVTINALPSGSASVTSAITCNNLSDGSITVTPSGGSGSGYTYKEVGGSYQASALFTGLVNGSHSFVVKDGNTCQSTTSISASLFNPTIVNISSVSKLSYNGSDLTCNGQSNGQITVVGAGGTGALQYSNGGAYQVSNVFTDLGSNSYTLIVKDANGCLSSSSVVTINEPTALSGTVSNNGPICANTTLSLSGSIAGGTGSKTYSWTGPNAYTSTASATLARTVSANATVAMSGTYTLTATDANNCTYNPTTNVVVNPIPTAGISGTTTVCKDAPSPNVTFTGANGTAPYTFTYNINGVGSYTVSTATALDNSVDVIAPTNVSGTFTYNLVSVVDASSTLCTGSASGSAIVTIKPKPILSSTAAPVTNTICEGTSTTVNCSNGASTLNAAVFTTAYSNNFSSSIGNAWTFPDIIPANVPSIQNYDGGSVLGYLSNQQAKLNLTSLPSHDSITVDFDLYIHDTWDGNSTVSGPDMFRVILDNGTALNTTFSNETWNSTTQSYPNNFSANNASFTGSLTRTLPTACNFGGGSLSAKYHITKKIAHTATTLEMILEAAGLENVCNESWSIDNMTVQYRSQSSNSNITWTNPSINNNSITVSPVVNTYYVATLNGCSDSLQIIVNPTPRAGFTINTVNQCVTGNSYDFTDTTTLVGGGAMTYAWTMTGASTTSATTQNVTGNTYANHGSYNVRLVATSVIGNCNDSRGRVTKTVNVSPRVVIKQSSPNPICAGNSVRLTANQVIGGSSAVVYTPTYTDNFETTIGNAWSFPAIIPANVPTVQSYNGQNVMGYLTNQKAVYNQTGLATHDYVKVEFDLYLHDSWDGNSTDSIGGSLIGKDIWKMKVNGSNIINTTFSNFSYRTQAYPNNIPTVNLNGTDAVSNTLPTRCNHSGGALSSVYRISKIIPHTSGSFNLELEALGLEELCNESWSIDNFNVELGVNTANPTLLSACNGLPVSGGPVVYTVNHSNNFQSSIGSAWSFPAISPANEPTISEFNGDTVLGFLTNQQAIYTQSGLSAHEYVKVEFDLYLHDTWDGNDPSTGVDSWKMNVDGNSVINTTFSNFSYRTQAYPNNAPAVNANFTGSVNSSLPARCNLGGGAPSSKYRISKIVPHNTSTISIVLEALGLEELCNESWSIDNFQLSLGAGSAPVSSATWNGGTVTGATSCFTDITPTTSTDYTVTIGACTSPITNIDVRPAPTPSFTISNVSCSKTVSFTNTNIEADVTYLWNFGDGSVVYSGTTAPNHTYSAVGTYTVTLSANILGGCTQTTTRTIKIADAPTAGIAFTGGTGCGNSVQFTNTSTIPSGNNASYLWSFGETPVADTSTLESPLHSYVADGNYTVTLTVSTGTNCSSSATVSVNALAAVTGNQAIFTATVGSSCGNMVTTTNSSTGTNNQYAWDFGDGSVSSEVAPTHYYTAGGFKTITLTILNGVGCATTSNKIVNISDNSGVNGRVGVDFAITPNTSQVLLTNDFGYEPTFTNYPNNVPVVYCAGAPTWTYGDGTGSSNTIIYSKRYAAAGTYTVRIVQQTTNTGCFAEASKTVTVLPNPLLQNNPISFKDGKIASLNNEFSTGLMNVNSNSNNLTLYPNPNKGTFKFQLNSNEITNGEIKVVDLLGRDVYKANFNRTTKTESIDLNSLNIAPGTYNLVVLNNGNVYARKAFVIIAE